MHTSKQRDRRIRGTLRPSKDDAPSAPPSVAGKSAVSIFSRSSQSFQGTSVRSKLVSIELEQRKREGAKRAAEDEEMAMLQRRMKEVEEQREIRKLEYEAELLNAEV